jgi:exportin-7
MAAPAPTAAQADAAAATLAGSGSPADLARVEALAEALYAAHDPAQRSNAEAQLLPLSRCSTAVLPQCTWILDNSASPYAQKFASWTLTKVVTANWGQVTANERVQLRNYVLQFLANKGVSLEHFVRLELSTLLCRVTKLGWNDGGADALHRKIVDDLSSFLEVSEEHCVIGLQVLVRLVAEMNATNPTTRRSFTQSQSRKVALSFRDTLLLQIFNISLATLAKLSPPPAHSRLRLDALTLALGCLSYDFVGSSLDDSNEDIGTIHIPIAWHTIIEDPTTVGLFMDTYAATCSADANQSKACLECLVQLASMRRTLFATEELRIANISRHVAATLDVLQSRRGLEDHQNYHHFCRWLARLKVNYQLEELISLDTYPTWIDLVAQFTLHSLASDWTWVGDSLYYLLSLWSRLIGAKPYLKGGKKAYLDDSVVKIVETYVSSRLMAISRVDDSADDPDDDDVSEHLEAIPLLFRLQYDRAAVFMTQLWDQRLENYKTFANSGGVGADPAQVSRLERELAWLTRVVGAVVSGRLNASSTEEQEITDGELSSRVVQLMIHTVDADRSAMLHRQQSGVAGGAGAGATKAGALAPSVHAATPHARARYTKGALALDEAIIEFSQAFRRTYIGEEAVATSKVYVRLAERLGMSDHMIVLDVVASKIAYNLRNYGVVDGERIVSKSLVLLSDLASGYSSSRLLCKLATVREMVANHGEEHFPFMKGADSKMGRHRTTFYTTLLRILFASGGAEFDSELEFARFMEPMRRKLTALATMPSKEAFLADPSVKAAVVGVLRDLRGVAATMSNRKSYSLFFEWMYPAHTPVLLRVCDVFSEAGAPDVTTPLLKLYAEFVNNKSQRIIFDSSSPSGILLFRETSKILVTYGNRTLVNWNRLGGVGAKPTSIDPYRMLYKGVWVCMSMFARALGGNYVNFGVFSLYGDPALSEAMAVCFRLQAAIPIDELLAYPKVAKAYFGFIEILCTNHPREIAELDHPTFLRVIQSLQEGLQSPEVWMSSQSAAAIDHLSAFRFRQTLKDTEHGRMMRAHVEQSPDMFSNCLNIIFAMICHVDCTNQWSLSRPLLSLILTNEDAFMHLKAQTIQSQATPERQAAVGLAFETLMKDIQPNIESKNRDRFTQQATHFRLELRDSYEG